ncbi:MULTISPECIES: tRNA/rRNA methyltransferase [Pantoea]|uniref:tRNA/rRNA methyltransferase n=1 Tax=Pantoea dispersa TaxID=59814 RepID=A0ABY2ZV43_9GAMM|nr:MULTISPECIES: tRNA/rRNA methyltransferase [Pantoea]MBU6518426.1 tRNA/rRNA methyltransferase [Pantoea sp. B270]MDT8849236.1 tRNA/rRNA methyltransferase [Pantoea dispersa]MEB5836639.1 tRNA/rRNA methyltransferase [Pantoea dispersa]NIE54095.1 tRNA/rRNA methyltransferase [Pantoea sp. Ap-870]TQC71185.1 tRNA/rRNA methyltransferase [Pantoea dispersa]
MNDEFKGKSGKVKVMYVRDEEGGQKPNPRTGKGGRPAARQEENRRSGPRSTRNNEESGRPRTARGDDAGRSRGPRDDSARGRRSDRDDRGFSDSPWRTVSRPPVAAEADAGDEAASSKPVIDPELIRRQRQEETRVYGENACQALFQSRPESIVRAWFVQSVTPRFRETLRWLAANRKAYHVVDDAELAKASGTEHHGGVCFIIKKRMGMPVAEWLQQAQSKDCVLALEDVSNPHNLGGIMRSCAHFGVKGLLVNDASLLESGAAVRTAEGGAEHVQAISGESFAAGLEAFRKAGYTIVTTSSHAGTPLAQAALPAKMVLVLGQEREGLSDSAFQQGDISLSIGGTGNVESLNVSVATGILLAEWWRQNA